MWTPLRDFCGRCVLTHMHTRRISTRTYIASTCTLVFSPRYCRHMTLTIYLHTCHSEIHTHTYTQIQVGNWCSLNGFLYGSKTTSGVFHHAPTTLCPQPFPRAVFTAVSDVQPLFNILIDKLSRDRDFLVSKLADTGTPSPIPDCTLHHTSAIAPHLHLPKLQNSTTLLLLLLRRRE